MGIKRKRYSEADIPSTLPTTVMNNYFTSVRLLNELVVNNI